MSRAATETYRERMERVVRYINEYPESSLSIEELRQVAHFSKFHFHRRFSEYMGISVFKYVQFVRLKRAAYRLAFRTSNGITDVALGAGFESSEAFSRAFKKAFLQSPSRFRNTPRWRPWHDTHQVLNHE